MEYKFLQNEAKLLLYCKLIVFVMILKYVMSNIICDVIFGSNIWTEVLPKIG